jgi:hypothetical protein
MAVKFDRRAAPRDLRDLVRQLRRAYADEVPTRIHVHQTDAGGDPAWSPEFTRYLVASDGATERDDNVYLTPFRAALAAMRRSSDPTTLNRAVLVARVVLSDHAPAEAAISMGVPDWCAKTVAADALRVFWDRLSDVRLDLHRTETAA